ncbi:MAG: cyclodeaminase/cyclohydrolase family protein [Nitrolancea sp.]
MPDDPVKSDRQTLLIDLPARTLIAQVADPSHNSGGGVAAGLTLAVAAASAELVLTLASRRKSLASSRPQIQSLLDSIHAHRVSFEEAADRDVAAFTQLVETQRSARDLKETNPKAAHMVLQAAYVQAAQAPLDVSRDALAFMHDVEQGLEFASRFTISDLGAAAALARGAIDAALLTVDANLAYVDDEQADTLRTQIPEVQTEAARIADRVVETARTVISRQPKGN